MEYNRNDNMIYKGPGARTVHLNMTPYTMIGHLRSAHASASTATLNITTMPCSETSFCARHACSTWNAQAKQPEKSPCAAAVRPV